MGQAKPNSSAQRPRSSTRLEDAKRDNRINVYMVQNVHLIWLDNDIDKNSSDCHNTISHLRRIVNTISTFTDVQECIKFLEDMAGEKVCIIASGTCGRQIVPRVHDLSQVDSIFIFCYNKQYHEGWTKEWSKVKGVYTEIRLICEALKQAAEQCEQNAVSISIMSGDGNDDNVEKYEDRVDASFMYTQVIKEILLSLKFHHKHIDRFIEHCRLVLDNNEKQLEYVNRLATSYRQHTPIWWYTCDCFLYSMLNRAIQTMDIDVIMQMGFFITDLHGQIEQLHQKQFRDDGSKQCFTVYRGQAMDKETVQKIIANEDGLLSFNGFLSTSKVMSSSLAFAERALADPHMVGVLFVLNIDPVRSSTPFASVADVGFFGKEKDEVLFSMHTIFRIRETKLMAGHTRLFQVQLELASGKDNDLRQLIEYIRNETFAESKGWCRLGSVLRKMRAFAKAQQLYEALLRQETEEAFKAVIYHQLGVMKRAQGEYAESIAFYEKSIAIKEKLIPRNDESLAGSYNNIGLVYLSMGQHIKALTAHKLALSIRQQTLPPIHLDLASSYGNIGNVYFSIGDYLQALPFYEKELVISEKLLLPGHLDLAVIYNNIGSIYGSMGNYPKALTNFEEALTIRHQSLPPTHPDLAMTYDSIGLVHENMGNYSKAHSYFERAVDIAQHSLPADHSDLKQWKDNLARIETKLE